MANYREERAAKILDNLNAEFIKENIAALTKDDLHQIEESVDGSLGRPHIADYLVKKGIVSKRDRKPSINTSSNVTYQNIPLYLEEASKLIRAAGGKLVLAHPDDPHGTSLAALTKALSEQTQIIKEKMLPYIDGVECWHSRAHSANNKPLCRVCQRERINHDRRQRLPPKTSLMGTVQIPDWVADQFKK